MKKSIDTKTDSSSGGLPWPPVAIASTTWHTNSPFFRDLLSDTQRLSKFMNLEGLGDRMKELSECSDDCSCKTVSDEDSESEDSEAREGLGGNYCPAGMMKLENREFVVLEQWIPKMNEAVERLVEIRDRMVAQASLSRRNLEERLALLNGEASRRILKKFPHGVDMPLMNNSPLCSDDDESISNGEAGPADDREDVTGLGSISPQTETRGLQIGNPSQSLPAEILYEVILEAQALDPHIHLNLSYVNQYFRNLVNTSPLLWSKVDFWYPLSVTSLYLERSAGASLDVTADRGCQQSRSQKIRAMEDTKISAFYELLRPHRHRIRRLKMQASSPLPLEAEIENGDQHSSEPGGRLESFLWSPMLCNLEHLDLGFVDWLSMDFPGQPVIKNLRELRLSGPCRASLLFLISPSLKRLTLEIPRLALPIIKNVLSSTPSLESLALLDVLLIETDSEISDLRVVDLQSLKSLSITRSSPRAIQSLFQAIACPNLEGLQLHFTGELNEVRTAIYRVFHPINVTQLQLFRKPHLRIRNLDLVSCEADPAFLQKTLDNLPGLKNLRIASAALTDEHLEALVFGKSPENRCPQLTSFTVDNEPEVSSTVIRRIVQSRNSEASIPLRSVTLRGFDSARVSRKDIELIRSSGVVDLTVMVFAEDEAVEGEKDGDWSSSWSSDEESEDELVSGDEDVTAR